MSAAVYIPTTSTPRPIYREPRYPDDFEPAFPGKGMPGLSSYAGHSSARAVAAEGSEFYTPEGLASRKAARQRRKGTYKTDYAHAILTGERRACACGCGALLPPVSFKNPGRPVPKFLHGHNSRVVGRRANDRTSRHLSAHSRTGARRRPKTDLAAAMPGGPARALERITMMNAARHGAATQPSLWENS